MGMLRKMLGLETGSKTFILGPNGEGEKAILDEALAIMARRSGGRPFRFDQQLQPDASAIEIVFFPPTERHPDGAIDAVSSYGPSPEETGECFADLTDGSFCEKTLEAVIGDIREHFRIIATRVAAGSKVE